MADRATARLAHPGELESTIALDTFGKPRVSASAESLASINDASGRRPARVEANRIDERVASRALPIDGLLSVLGPLVQSQPQQLP